ASSLSRGSALSTGLFICRRSHVTPSLSLHDALPIWFASPGARRSSILNSRSSSGGHGLQLIDTVAERFGIAFEDRPPDEDRELRSEGHTSELQSPDHLVCRLLLEKQIIDHNSVQF